MDTYTHQSQQSTKRKRNAPRLVSPGNYRSYLRDVVMALTPPFQGHEDPFALAENWMCSRYVAFVGNLFRLQWTRSRGDRAGAVESTHGDGPAYSVVSLNYDLVLERSLALLTQVTSSLRFESQGSNTNDGSSVVLSKLHGSVEPLSIVPPTWNKQAARRVRAAWRSAHRSLAEATQIRFLGYSLPETDTYVRYLLASAVLECRNLKHIDVVCLDPQGQVRKRYERIVGYSGLRFLPVRIEDYLTRGAAHGHLVDDVTEYGEKQRERRSFLALEHHHQQVMSAGN